MTLLGGIHHVAIRTPDLDRLLEFYRTVFDASVARDVIEDGARNVLVDVGGGSYLHAFVDPDAASSPGGRFDHVALAAPTAAAFLELRDRLLAAGGTDGRVRDFGVAWSLRFRDPDGMNGEVFWVKDPDVPLAAGRARADVEIVPADQLLGQHA